MFKNYIKTAYRSLYKNKGFTAINILGLALGLATCLLIVFYVVDELSYDRYNTKADRIYRVNEDLKLGDNQVQYAVAMPPLAKTLKAEYPYVEDATRIKPAGTTHVKKGNSNIVENKVGFVDASIFNVFTLPMISGDPKTALLEPNTVVITESTAKKYFNTTAALGKTIIFNDKENFKVTGVIKDVPKNSHFNFDFFVSLESFPDSRSNEWLRSNYNTYVLLKDAKDHTKLAASFPAFLQKFSGAQMQSELGMNIAQFEKGGSYFRLNLTALTDIHLNSNLTGELGPNSTKEYVYIFSAIAIFILLIACVNFMNLSTARSSNRAREVGVRKVLGSSRKNLIFQFLAESILITFIATIIAVIAASVLLPAFNQISGKDIILTTQSLKWLVPALLLIVLVIGSLAGSYPAFFLSAFQPIAVLKGKLSAGFKGGGLRSFLVVFQFFVSILLIVGTLVIYNQLNFIQTKNLGYNRNQVLIVQNSGELNQQAGVFKQELAQLPGVKSATMTGFLPTNGWRNTRIYFKDASYDQKKSLFPQSWEVDADYIPTMDMKLAAGRNFSKEMQTDSSAIIINEAAAKFLGFADPVGKTVYQSLGGDRKGNTPNVKECHIVGVVKDFHFNSLRQKIEPIVLTYGQNAGALAIRVGSADIQSLMSQIKAKWNSLSPGVQINYSFMDQDFDLSYRSEQRIGKIFVIFTSLAIIIACLGLFGLAAYAAEQRTKEIGIRKVLGANVTWIVTMLSKDFIKLVCIAIVTASPIAWFVMNKWLQDFAYRITIQWWVIAAAAVGSLLIAFITISFQSVKAAIANPVNSLRSE
ncbi:ABC transporter permease [Mucilaginibacter phyllosphaerae]|uniref:ABC transport system permease protein n=1 Tax=Mucilaginibacter phyllosphaerae TaxID=1812349 RepID=A0A4Y8A781_9SPHI|nr:ABC transporter permease [Mucilaginibacter phyllosphaerae]MBB3970870.1 putative ABC transport system permease protein [Mucilaginibacter phyllosphaerae]TEW64195.1 FtsX-like permease family protein [Mucilaginibacter phyllosphaerae]GGH05121.1 ABC transporter permease [Mucilaginibacter phyllosphaerae]